MTRKDYMDGKVSHQDYYMEVARTIGLSELQRIVRAVASPERIKEALQTDKNLNNIPLYRWDLMDVPVRSLIAMHESSKVMAISWGGAPLTPKTFCWSLSESVCVLKAVARDMVKEVA